MKIYKRFLLILIILILTGCWNSSEVDDEAIVHGVGFDFDKESNMLEVYAEVVKPTPSEDASFQSAENLVLQLEAESPLHGAREFIRNVKRRLQFGHTRLWIVGEDLAKEPFVPVFDVIRRDPMNRLNSYIFITKDEIDEIFMTTTLYENLSSDEIVSGLEQSKFTAEFIPVLLYEFIGLNEERLQTAYLPIINVVEDVSGTITSIEGTAVIKEQRMVGELNIDETVGLAVLTDRAQGGVITVPTIEEGEIISMEVKGSNTTVSPKLHGKELHVKIDVSVYGELGDNVMVNPEEINENFILEAEKLIEKDLESTLRATLDKLQELKADITDIGVETYRSFPQKWKNIESIYHDEIFPDATIDINISADIFHQGLTNQSVNEPQKKPYNNPFPFFN